MKKFYLSKVAFTILLLLTSIRLIAEDQSVSFTFVDHFEEATEIPSYPLDKYILLTTSQGANKTTIPKYFPNKTKTKSAL